MTPVVSICIPTYRRLGYLKEAVAAAQAQTLPDIEIIISDDGDNTDIKAWSESAARADSRITYRRNDRNLGLGGNWNACAMAARGAWAVIQGDDDRLLPSFCEALTRLAASDSAVVFSNHFVIDEGGRRLDDETASWTTRYHRDALSRGRVEDAALCVWSNSVPMTAALIRSDVLKRFGIKDDLNTPEIELFARVAASGARFDFEPGLLAEFRTHAGSSTASGLFSERLVRYLEPIAVPESANGAKHAYMAALTRDAVDRLLRAGHRARAREVMSSRYYPSGYTDPTVLAQRVAARLPLQLGTGTYLLARRLRDAVSARRAARSS